MLGAIAALASAVLQANAQADERNLQYTNLYEQKRQAREREKLAKATRSDAYGNSVEYIPGVGFVTKTTPFTKSILDSQQKEQLAQFRDDAPRVRDAAIRIDNRSKKAGEEFDEVFNKYKYRRKKTEAEYVAEAVRNTIDSRRDRKKSSGTNAQLARLATRTGNSGDIPELLAAASGAESEEETLSEALANAQTRGKQQHLAETNAETQSFFGEMGGLREIADAILKGESNWNNENAALSGKQDGALNELIQTNANNSTATGNAYNTAAAAAGKFPDLSDLTSSLNSFKFGGSGEKPMTEEERLLADLLVREKIGSAELGIMKNRSLGAYRGNTGAF